MAQAAVAHRDRALIEPTEDRPHDARAGEDHLGPARLQTDDRTTPVGVAGAVELDLAIEFVDVEHRAVHHIGVVAREHGAPRRGS